MGKVQCQFHGGQIGQLCCVHISSAVHGSAPILPDAAVRAGIDLMEDGSDLLPVVFCQVCAAQYGIAPLAKLPGQVLETPGLIPYIAPTCGVCFTAWDASRNQSDA
jgi:hypothetical protein